ncbi:hypothetical protein ACQKOF_17955 [Lysinibacillus sp. NPDC093190]
MHKELLSDSVTSTALGQQMFFVRKRSANAATGTDVWTPAERS